MRFLIAQINPTVGDFQGNFVKILSGIDLARQQNIDLVLFPELALSGYPPSDFLLLPDYIEAAEVFLKKIIEASHGIALIVGLPRKNPAGGEKGLYNSAAIIEDGVLLGFQDKRLLPTYDVFDERRYFDSGLTNPIWKIAGHSLGVTICEDIWQHSEILKEAKYQHDPIHELAVQKPEYIVNLSASPYNMNKIAARIEVCRRAALSLGCPLLLCNQVGANDSLIFDGHSLCMAKSGELLAMAKGFEEDFMIIDFDQKIAQPVEVRDSLEELYKALVLGVRDYFRKLGFMKACLGLSGGIDSAVTACIAVEALGADKVLGINMPSRYSSDVSLQDSMKLANNLGIECHVIPIEKPFQTYIDLLISEFEGKATDVTEENLQARIRGMLLMALSNKHGYIVLSTGNKSELAVGYSTLYGDMCGGLSVINDLTKRQVYALAGWINRDKEIIPLRTIQRAPSAELRYNQLDSDSLPDYDIVDNVVEGYVEMHLSKKEIAGKFGYPMEVVDSLIHKIHRNEYKRRQSPPGLRVTQKAFTAGRFFPIVQGFV